MRIENKHLAATIRIAVEHPRAGFIDFFAKDILLPSWETTAFERVMQMMFPGGPSSVKLNIEELTVLSAVFHAVVPVWIAYGQELPFVRLKDYRTLLECEPRGFPRDFWEWFHKGLPLWGEVIEHPLKSSRPTGRVVAARIARAMLQPVMVPDKPGEILDAIPSNYKPSQPSQALHA